jgi:predicted nucleic acid-binding protein
VIATELVDTSVLINLERQRDAPSIRRFFKGRAIALSTVTLAELLFGAYTAKVPEEERRRTRRFVTFTRRRAKIIALDRAIADTIAETWAEHVERKFTPSSFDLVIAATALAKGLELVTAETVDARRRKTFNEIATFKPLKVVYLPPS